MENICSVKVNQLHNIYVPLVNKVNIQTYFRLGVCKTCSINKHLKQLASVQIFLYDNQMFRYHAICLRHGWSMFMDPCILGKTTLIQQSIVSNLLASL